MNNQTLSKMWVVIVAVLLAGGIFAWQYFGAPKEEVRVPEEKVQEEVRAPEEKVAEEEVKEETADWQTYRNEKYEFEVKYPKDFNLKEVGKGIKIVFPDSYIIHSSYIFKNDVTEAWIGVGTGIMEKEGFMGELCQKLEKLGDEEVKINNLNFIKGNISENAMGGWYTDYNIYRTSYNGVCYEILLAVTGKGPGAGANDGMGPLPQDYASPDSKEKFISILDQMLSTFRFLE